MLWHSWTVKITGPVINLRRWQRLLGKVRLIHWNWWMVSRLFNMWLSINSQKALKCCKLKQRSIHISTAGRLITVVDYILKVTLPICLNMIYGYYTFICAIVCTVMDRSEVSQQEMGLSEHTPCSVAVSLPKLCTPVFFRHCMSPHWFSQQRLKPINKRREWGVIMKTCFLKHKNSTKMASSPGL